MHIQTHIHTHTPFIAHAHATQENYHKRFACGCVPAHLQQVARVSGASPLVAAVPQPPQPPPLLLVRLGAQLHVCVMVCGMSSPWFEEPTSFCTHGEQGQDVPVYLLEMGYICSLNRP